MALPWELRGRGLKDSLRHDIRVKEAIRKNLRELIAEEAIITSDGKKKIKIPVRYLEQFRFKYGNPHGGVGQGSGKSGDVLGRRGGTGDGSGSGMPGDEPGELTYEVEFSLDDLARMMLEDLALPWLEEKPKRQITTHHSYEHRDIRRRGALANLDKRRTLLANLKRNAARGITGVGGIKDDDLRFRVWDEHEEQHANAAVYLLMDRSGSMTTDKKHIAKSFFFWMVRFLRFKYDYVAPVFIAHDTEAAVVPEKDFFTLSNDGGTRCSSAYAMALELIVGNHPKDEWSTYLFHFSDGDNQFVDNTVCKTLVEHLLGQCTMVGYGEIRHDADYGWGGVYSSEGSLQHALNTIAHPRLVSVTIKSQAELYQTLEKFLKVQESGIV